MSRAAQIQVMVWWLLWAFPYLFLAPKRQKRASITAFGPSMIGVLLEMAAISVAFLRPLRADIGVWELAVSAAFGLVGNLLFWTAVRHLGKQFRIHAGLYEDHQLVRTGPYAIVRHPIYASLLSMLLCTQFALTRWQLAMISLVLFIVGTEIRVHTEEALLASRFGDQFTTYKNSVPAYVPFVR